MQSLMILGRQPALGLAELESLYGGAVTAVSSSTASALKTPADVSSETAVTAALVDVDPCLLAFDRLGGSTKFCKVLTALDTTEWKQIEKFLLQVSPGHSQNMPEGKMQLGLSLYGFRETPQRIGATGLSLKKVIRREHGRPVRLIPNKTSELNAAQVIHNNLTGPNGWELVFVKDDTRTIVAQTVKVQDIESYTRRDRGRPRRDARVGMLPPKLAQIIINLAVGELPAEARQSVCEIPPEQPIPKIHYKDVSLLDPFCGTGVILQEATLMGYDIYGTDLDPRMVEYTDQNMGWLNSTYGFAWVQEDKAAVTGDNANIEQADATSYHWPEKVTNVASETYLGRPFTAPPSAAILAQTMTDCNLIIKKFLRNIHGQLAPGTRLCLAVPAWQTRPGQFTHLPLVDSLKELGYNRVKFERVRDADLIYYRPDQIVARQLIVMTRK